jgi:ubiquinone/menaquinone biosynthesis C-methylase UbiE
MTELELLIDLHSNSSRQGPGSKEDTLKALEYINLPTNLPWKVADIGCGSGGQTITLAQNSPAEITAIDLFPIFLNELNDKSRKLGLTENIVPLQASMEDLPFKAAELDLIWSEGAIYNIGFSEGIKLWKEYLKIGGYLAVSEITWLTPSRPVEIEEFWKEEYPEITTASTKISQLEENGYSLQGYFHLSPKSWLDGFYGPMAGRFQAFLDRNNHSDLAQKVVRDSEDEIALYKKYQDYYSYGFYIARREG